MKGNLDKTVKALRALVPADMAATTVTGPDIDCEGYSEALFILSTGVIATSLDVKLQEANEHATTPDTAGTYADVAGAAFTQITSANDDTVYVMRVDLTQRRRFLRLTETGVGTTGAYAASVILTPSEWPASQAQTAISV